MKPIYQCGSFSVYPAEKKDGSLDKYNVIIDTGRDSLVMHLSDIVVFGNSLVDYMQSLNHNVSSN